MFYREANPGSVLPRPTGKTFLLLHGQAFTSKTWQDTLPTIQTLATLGNRVLAIDLPGYGNTAKAAGSNPEEFLAQVISTLSPNRKPIVVSPSMSGAYSLPLLLNGKGIQSYIHFLG